MELIRSEQKVPEETRQARRRHKPNEGRLTGRRTHEAAKASQSWTTHSYPGNSLLC